MALAQKSNCGHRLSEHGPVHIWTVYPLEIGGQQENHYMIDPGQSGLTPQIWLSFFLMGNTAYAVTINSRVCLMVLFIPV